MSSFSLVLGGPFYRLLCRTRLVRPGEFSSLRPAIAAVSLAWGGMALTSAVEALGSGRIDPLLADYSVVARCWGALPLFFFAESQLHMRVTRTMQRFEQAEFTSGDDTAEVTRILQRALRARDANGVENALALLVLALGAAALWTPGTGLSWLHGLRDLRDASVPAGVTPVRVWWTLVALPLFQFLLLRWLWRWAIWSYVVIALARLPLRLISTHPDLAAGIGLLADPTYAFSIFAAGGSAAVAGTWSTQVMRWKTPLQSFAPPLIVLVLVAMLLAFGALLAFMRMLMHARFDGLRDYGQLALVHNRLFHQRWVERAAAGESPLGAPEISSLTDLQSAHATMASTRVIPFGPREVLTLLSCLAIPMLPLVAVAIPLKELVNTLLHAVFSDLP